MPNLKINNKTYSGVSEVHIPLADGSGNEDFAYINSETKSITENGTHDVKHYGTVNVNVPTEGDGITPTGTKTITENGTYDVTEYASAKVEVPSEEPNIQSLNVTANGTYTAPSGVDGYSPVTVNVPTESDIELQQKTVTPSETAQTITPDSGYDGLASVSVGAISKTYVGSGVTKKSAQTYTPGTSNQTIASGQYLNGTQTIQGDSDLVAGNIKSGVSIFGVTGTYEGTGGIDTSDATATATDIASGKTAYVNGEKITGSVVAYDSQVGWPDITPSLNGSQVKLAIAPGVPYLFRNGYFLSSPLSNFGTATAADVAKGKTFTSSSGLKVTGTHECSSGDSGGGLPSGVSALASGTYTPTENKTARVDVAHGLGVTPNFLVVMMEEDTSSAPLTSALVGATVFFKNMKYNSGSTIQYTAHVTMEGYGASSQATGSATRAASNAYFTTTTVGIPCNSTYVLKSGYTYRWVCGVLDGIN